VKGISTDPAQSFKSFVYNVFIVGLTFSSFLSLIGMMLNPVNIISISGLFYIMGIFIYVAILFDALYSFYE
jgi:hypothetical protein